MLPSLQPAKGKVARSFGVSYQVGQIGLLLLSTAIVIAVVAVYIASERTFYWWDYVTYSDLVDRKIVDLFQAPLRALQQTWWSTNKDYSDYPTLALLPLVIVFGNARFVYIFSVAIAYLLPFALVLGAIATRLVPSPPKAAVYWSTVFLTFLIPAFWAPTLRGYVDAGAGLLIVLATFLYVQDVTLQHYRQIVGIGFCLGFAPLFRRHFAYADIAFFAAMCLQVLLNTTRLRQRQESFRFLMVSSLRIGLVGVTSLATIVLLGLPFVVKVLHTNFGSLYADYEVPLSQGLQYYGLSYGWIICLLAVLGYVAGVKTHVLARPVATFMLLFSTLLLLLWVVKVKQIGVHYTTHFTAFIVLGLVAFGWTVWQTLRQRRLLVLSVSGVYLVLNLVLGLVVPDGLNHTPLRLTRFGMSILPDQTGTKLSELFSASYPPLRRADYDEVARLVDYLRDLTPHHEPIYIGASSAALNAFALKKADLNLHPQQGLTLLLDENIDSRDKYPIERLLQAEYVVVTEPFQYHIRPEDQKIVQVIGDIFSQNWAIAQDFSRLPERFSVANGVTVSVYKRIRSTALATTLQTLEAMKAYVNMRPGGQLDWIVASRIPGYYTWVGRGIAYIQTDLEHSVRLNTVLYINPLPQPVAKITGQVTYLNDPNYQQCRSGVTLRFNALDAQAQVLNTATIAHAPNGASAFSLPMHMGAAKYLSLDLSDQPSQEAALDRCNFMLSQLTVAPA